VIFPSLIAYPLTILLSLTGGLIFAESFIYGIVLALALPVLIRHPALQLMSSFRVARCVPRMAGEITFGSRVR
jgi:hypothetical protein